MTFPQKKIPKITSGKQQCIRDQENYESENVSKYHHDDVKTMNLSLKINIQASISPAKFWNAYIL
jgi:hypothetical protein